MSSDPERRLYYKVRGLVLRRRGFDIADMGLSISLGDFALMD